MMQLILECRLLLIALLLYSRWWIKFARSWRYPNHAMANQANKHCCYCDIVVGDHAWLSTEYLLLVSWLSKKLAICFI